MPYTYYANNKQNETGDSYTSTVQYRHLKVESLFEIANTPEI